MSETWTLVCPTIDLLPGEMKVAYDAVHGTPIAVFNMDGMLYALEDQCTHEDFELSAGAFDHGAATIECVLHGSRFNVRDGRALNPPAYAPVRTYRTKIEDDAVWILVDD